jgi:hypothetical protein
VLLFGQSFNGARQDRSHFLSQGFDVQRRRS